MTMFMETGLPGLTLEFLCIVVALTIALIRLFCALEQSTPLARFRTALVDQINHPTRRH